jgi:chitinase
MITVKNLFLLALFAFFVQITHAQKLSPKFRIVGYIKGDLEVDGGKIDFDKLTHLNVAFINPDSTGAFAEVRGLKEIVKNAHSHQVKVLVSIAGGRAPAYLRSLVSSSNRASFVAHLLKLMNDYELDGIDVDFEGSFLNQDYEGFITELAKAIKPKGLLTAAVSTQYGARFTALSLQQFDFINIMSYDKTGPWRPQNGGPHSTLTMAVDDLEYWQREKGVAKDKLSLGVPFYGYSFGPAGAGSLPYKRIVTTYPGSEDKDEVKTPDGGILYYNGTATIKTKTRLAMDKAGGIMLWQLLQDATGPGSLTDIIYTEVSSKSKKK